MTLFLPGQGFQSFSRNGLLGLFNPGQTLGAVLPGIQIRFPHDGEPMGGRGSAAVEIGNGIGTLHG